MAAELPNNGAVLAGGYDGAQPPDYSIVSQRPAAGANSGDSAAGPWPTWARVQLDRAVEVAGDATDGISIAALLYREWFSPVVDDDCPPPPRDALAGLYRAAHAGSGRRLRFGDMSVVERRDVIRPGGWWRTWGRDWTPPRARRGSVRLFLTPRPDRLADFVSTVTGHFLDERAPWSLACATDPRRVARSGCAVLDLAAPDMLPADLLAELAPMLRAVEPPLCLPIATGVAAAEYPDNGMTFGEHRCHLVALALRHPSAGRDPLRAVAAVFRAHGLNPAAPYRTN